MINLNAGMIALGHLLGMEYKLHSHFLFL